MAVKQLRSIYQLKVSLVGSKPPIWRHLLVHSHIDLEILHIVIQISMGWANCHLHQFEKDRIIYGIPDDEFGGDFGFDSEDESEYKLSDLLKREKDSLIYEYDFGDSWTHKIILEKILPFETSSETAKCIKGKRACPPEDCGGIWGYSELIETISDPSDPEYEETMEWLGGEFDPEYFSLDEVNELLLEHVK